jgi:hypothetical protein
MIGVWSSPIEILLVVVLINHQHLTVARTDFSRRCLDRRHTLQVHWMLPVIIVLIMAAGFLTTKGAVREINDPRRTHHHTRANHRCSRVESKGGELDLWTPLPHILPLPMWVAFYTENT